MTRNVRSRGPYLLLAVVAVSMLLMVVSCNLRNDFHSRAGWIPQKCFDDDQVVALCKAIEANNLAEVDRLIEAGADVNARGEGNLTPLLWAFPLKDPSIFKRLLESGADPNVILSQTFEVGKLTFRKGEAVTHFVSRFGSDEQFFAVFEHGGDVQLVSHAKLMEGLRTIHLVIRSRGDRQARIRRLYDLGANLDQSHRCYRTPAETAVLNNEYGLALTLLQLGADPDHYSQPNSNWKLVHHLAFAEESLLPFASSAAKEEFHQLKMWLEERGETLDQAKKDIQRWRTLGLTGKDRGEKMREEVHQRQVRERQKRIAAEQEQSAETKEAAADDSTEN